MGRDGERGICRTGEAAQWDSQVYCKGGTSRHETCDEQIVMGTNCAASLLSMLMLIFQPDFITTALKKN